MMKGKKFIISTLAAVILLFLFLIGIPLLVHRWLHGKYGFDAHGFNIVIIISVGIVFLAMQSCQRKVPQLLLAVFTIIMVATTVLLYLSFNALWCAQHPSVTKAMCAKLRKFASFAADENIESWWLTLGDMLAIQRGHTMPMAWEHDIDICITQEEVLRFKKALESRETFFKPKAIHYETNHWYIPIDMEKLGLQARDAEGVNIDVWTCAKTFSGNISQVLYCDGYMNVPRSTEERHILLTKEYGDYSVVKYDHHQTLCKLWNG